MTPLALFGLFAVSSMLVCYAFEKRSAWFILGFAVACALWVRVRVPSGAWPFGIVEAIWSLVAVQTVVGELPSLHAEEALVRACVTGLRMPRIAGNVER